MPGEKSGEEKEVTTGNVSMVMCKASNCLKMGSVQGNEVWFLASAEDKEQLCLVLLLQNEVSYLLLSKDKTLLYCFPWRMRDWSW